MLGTVRTLWVVPRFGTRMAELMETPIMLVVTMVAARWIVRRLAVPSVPSSPWHGFCRAWTDARRGIRVCALASRPVDQRVSRYPRPCVGNHLLRDAGGFCHHAASRGWKMRSPIRLGVVHSATFCQTRWERGNDGADQQYNPKRDIKGEP